MDWEAAKLTTIIMVGSALAFTAIVFGINWALERGLGEWVLAAVVIACLWAMLYSGLKR